MKVFTSLCIAVLILLSTDFSVRAQSGLNDDVAKPQLTSDTHQTAELIKSTGASDRGPRVLLQSASKGPNRRAARDQSSEMAKDFERDCPNITITINPSRADYTVSLNHIEAGLFSRDNQFDVYDVDGDRLKGTEGVSINKGIKSICALIGMDWSAKVQILAEGSSIPKATAQAGDPRP